LLDCLSCVLHLNMSQASRTVRSLCVSPASMNVSLGCSHQPWLRAWADEATGSCSLQLPFASSTWSFPLLQQDGAGTASAWKQGTELPFGPEEAWVYGKIVRSGKPQFWALLGSTNLCKQRFILSQFAICRMGMGAPWRGICGSEDMERVYCTRNKWLHNHLCMVGVLQSHTNHQQIAALGTGLCYLITAKLD